MIKANFVPLAEGPSFQDLRLLKAVLEKKIDDVSSKFKASRQNLAKRLKITRGRITANALKAGQVKAEKELTAKLLELIIFREELAKEVQSECLELIELICQKSLKAYPKALAEVISAQIERQLSTTNSRHLVSIHVSKGLKENLRDYSIKGLQIQENESLAPGRIVFETKTGAIEISLLADLKAAFLALKSAMKEQSSQGTDFSEHTLLFK
jgi:flagellar biosynthesis/type III secretory pathway protein FliH